MPQRAHLEAMSSRAEGLGVLVEASVSTTGGLGEGCFSLMITSSARGCSG